MKYMKTLTPDNAEFSVNKNGILRIELKNEVCCPRVICKRLFPVRHTEKFISILDGKDEIGIIEDLSVFNSKTQKLIRNELDFLFGIPTIRTIREIKDEYGFFHWDVETDRGSRDFYVKGRTDSVTQAEDGRIFITDIHSCRFQILSPDSLPAKSRSEMGKML